MIANELKIAKTNDIKGVYRLIERIKSGKILEVAQACIEACLLNEEASHRFFELMDRQSFWQYLAVYIRILLNREKVQKYIDRDVICGDRVNQMLLADTIIEYPDTDLDAKFDSGGLFAGMSFYEIKVVMGFQPNLKRRQTKKVREEHARELRSAQLEHFYATHPTH